LAKLTRATDCCDSTFRRFKSGNDVENHPTEKDRTPGTERWVSY
jgi:hypothetical protein